MRFSAICMEEERMQIKAENIKKIIGGNVIFDNLTLEVQAGERVALVGRNGSGKTTLFKLLANVEQPDEGRIVKAKGSSIGYLAQIPEYPGSTVRDVLCLAFQKLVDMQSKMNLIEQQMTIEVTDSLLHQYGEIQEKFMQLGGYEMEAKMASVLNGLGIAQLIESEFDSLSGGEKTKVMLAQMILQNPDILLLDEPTNHLDLAAIEWLENFIRHFAGTVVIISHDRQFLNHVVQKVFEIEDGEIWVSKGTYDDYVQNKQLKVEQQFAQYEEQQKKIKKIREAIRRLRQWANEASPPNPDLYRKAKVMEKMLERMELVAKPKTEKKMNLQFETKDRSGKEVIVLQDVAYGFDDNVLFMDANLSVFWQDRLAIVGNNGTGKSTLLKIMLQQLKPICGDMRLGSNVEVGYLAQQFDTFNPKMRLIDVFRENVSITEGEARHVLAQFLFYGHDVFKKVKDLSGGEKMRLRLAQLMQQNCNLLVLDEPTNHLDIESREVLEETLEKFNGTIIAISHDRYFLQKLFTKTAWIENGQVHVHNGPYDWAREKQNSLCIK